jgi:dihydroflavonol-4-reductase
VSVCVTGATGFIGAHVAKLASERHGPPRVTYRDERRLERLAGTEAGPVRADLLDRRALRRAFRGCSTVFHCAGLVASRPAALVSGLNALSPRIAVGAAAAEGVRRIVITSSVAGIGPAPLDRPGSEEDVYREGGLGLTLRGRLPAIVDGETNIVDVRDVAKRHLLAAERGSPGERGAPKGSC